MNIDAHNITRAKLSVAEIGTWVLEIDADAPELTGSVVVTLPGAILHGTVDPTSATYQERNYLTVVGGANGWSKILPPATPYAAIQTRTVVEHLCQLNGEKLGTFVPQASTLKLFTRTQDRASVSLQAAIGNAPWWVDYQGLTQVGPRPSTTMKEYQVLGFDPQRSELELGLHDLSELAVGAIVSRNLDRPQTIREFVATIDDRGVTAVCKVGSANNTLIAIFNALIDQRLARTLTTSQEYRVIRMQGDKVELQIVDKSTGYPDLVPVSMMPGVAGCHAELQVGATVIVDWINGDRKRPTITSFAGRDGAGFKPVSLVIGGPSGEPAARVDDSVESGGPGTIVTLMPLSGAGAPPNNAIVAGVPCRISFDSTPPTPTTAAKLTGAITSGSSTVEIA